MNARGHSSLVSRPPRVIRGSTARPTLDREAGTGFSGTPPETDDFLDGARATIPRPKSRGALRSFGDAVLQHGEYLGVERVVRGQAGDPLVAASAAQGAPATASARTLSGSSGTSNCRAASTVASRKSGR